MRAIIYTPFAVFFLGSRGAHVVRPKHPQPRRLGEWMRVEFFTVRVVLSMFRGNFYVATYQR